ncbi:MAG: reverse transcriptase family protein, partial [Bacteroidota bacterium]
ISYCRARAKQKRAFKEARRESWKTYISTLTSKTPPKQIWDRIRKLQGKFSPSPLPVLKIGSDFITHPVDVAETLAAHFAGVSSANHYPVEFQAIRNTTRIVPPLSSNTESYNLNYSILEFENAISKSSPTSPGEDGILYSFVSHLPQDTKHFLLDIYNGLWSSDSSPTSWHTSLIVSILKPLKDPNLPQSYRPIALTSCLCKIFERMVNTRLVWILESRKLLSNRQFGFRKNRSTMDPLLMLSREVQHAIASQNQTIAVFFDIEKAYDTTWRDGILEQLASWGIGGHMFAFLGNFLSNRLLKVRVGSEFSSAHGQEEGVPQGSVVSVTLFCVAMNRLLETVPVGVQSSAYADDFSLYCSASTALEAGRRVQNAINRASATARSRGFKFSPLKTKAMRFSR